jgi:hypothetical protein
MLESEHYFLSSLVTRESRLSAPLATTNFNAHCFSF